MTSQQRQHFNAGCSGQGDDLLMHLASITFVSRQTSSHPGLSINSTSPIFPFQHREAPTTHQDLFLHTIRPPQQKTTTKTHLKNPSQKNPSNQSISQPHPLQTQTSEQPLLLHTHKSPSLEPHTHSHATSRADSHKTRPTPPSIHPGRTPSRRCPDGDTLPYYSLPFTFLDRPSLLPRRVCNFNHFGTVVTTSPMVTTQFLLPAFNMDVR